MKQLDMKALSAASQVIAVLTRHRWMLIGGAFFVCDVAVAQSSSPDSVKIGMRGTVVTAVGDRPVDGAVVTLAEVQMSVTTIKTGGYQFVSVVPGTYTVRVRKIGFNPLDARVTIPTKGALEADLELEAAPAQTLEGLTVHADSAHSDAIGGLADRMRFNSNGIFLTSAQLDSARGTPLHELLRKRVRGVNIVLYVQTNQHLLATSRGQTSLTQVPKADPGDRKSPSRNCL
jgi:hypothetical protein